MLKVGEKTLEQEIPQYCFLMCVFFRYEGSERARVEGGGMGKQASKRAYVEHAPFSVGISGR